MGKLAINKWAENDRPREKLERRGRRVLSNAELLAILIGSGSFGEDAVGLARRILSDHQHNLDFLSQQDVDDLKKYKGIGSAKAITIIAALELGRRRKESTEKEAIILNCSKKVFEYFKFQLQDLLHEEFWVLYLNRASVILNQQLIGKGGNDFTPVDVRIILKHALNCQASSMILVHNHPSGSLKPSNQDLQLTKKIVDASKIMDIRVMDHVIFTNSKYFSFQDEGLMD
ncbi:RadC family protein [Sphingobacterium spiritivorum]|uniref:DNA repair protein RadC n=1 Tax=Sphingobacterium spiritivorum ATCC 33861 TaxID=525373 RepID=D7VPL1_SPHSI|nr:DNA repair protein RadC [Sphingobacterium spiritivorum]EFK57858.1 DNA repair protein RadC [Sphingobacterium spiritivorum ATCC 33861]QQT36118.1 DNA repair protein RadC [Sphingobacterium spiritivorum]WQD32851.1 DNA repair protein RadC [Sphingobacterium spiritivorum]SUJ15615.1 DNA repair protein RadC [Sphingobacterium spiritivorum]